LKRKQELSTLIIGKKYCSFLVKFQFIKKVIKNNKSPAMKDLKKELERYARNNYTKSETIERLKHDGFDISEINAHMAEQLDEAQDRIFLNMFYFFPTFIYLLSLVIFSMLGISAFENLAYKGLSFLALIVFVFTTYQYYKEKAKSIIFVTFLLYIGFLFLIYALAARIITGLEIPLLNYWTIVPSAILLFFMGRINYSYYKEIKNK